MKTINVIFASMLVLSVAYSNTAKVQKGDGGYGPQPFVRVIENLNDDRGSKLGLDSDAFSFISISDAKKVNERIRGINFNLIRVLDNAWLLLGEVGLRGTSLPVVFLAASPEKDVVKTYYKSGQYFSFPLDGDTGYIYISTEKGSETGEWIVRFAVLTDHLFKENPDLERRYRYAGEIHETDTPLFMSWTFRTLPQ